MNLGRFRGSRVSCFIRLAVKHAVPRRSYTLRKVRYQARSGVDGPSRSGKPRSPFFFSGNSRKVVDRRDAVVHWSRPAAWGPRWNRGLGGAAIPLESGRQAQPLCGPAYGGGVGCPTFGSSLESQLRRLV